jgi:DNA-binding transcriptional LysR family regulator
VLVESGGFTKTAEKLHMTQPGVSQHVKWLEDHLQKKLINRLGKSFSLTIEGEKIYRYALELFKRHQGFLQTLSIDDPQSGLCLMASPGSFGMKMYSFLLRVNKKYQNLSISFFYAPNLSIEKDLLEDKIDLGFMSIKPRHPGLEFKSIDKEELCLVVPKNFNGKKLSDLNELGLINHPDASLMVSEVFALNFPKEFKNFEQLKKSGACNQIGRILEPVALGLGYTVLPEFACKAFLVQKSLKYFKLKERTESIIYQVKKKYKVLPSRYEFILKKY